MKRSAFQMRLLLVAGIVILVGFLSTRFSFRLDLTGDQRYTLSKATLNVLNSIDEPVTVVAYFTEGLPPEHEKAKIDFRDLLVEYSNRSKGNVVYEFINPNVDESTEQKAMSEGMQFRPIEVREKDQIKVQKAYRGALVKMGNEKEIIPLIETGSAMEYSLTSAIKKMSVKNKPKVALLQGHGEPSPEAMQQVRMVLSVLYEVSPYTINDTIPIPSSFKTLAIVAPQDSFSAIELQRLDEYMNNGGNILVALNRVNGDLQNQMGSPVNTGLEIWLEQKGISVEEKFIMEAPPNCGSVTMIQQMAFGTVQTPIAFPYFPLVQNFADHPISKGIERMVMIFASPVTFSFTDTSITTTVLATTSKMSNTTPGSTFFDVMKQYMESDFPLSSLPLAIAVEGKINGTRASKMVVFGDGDFAVSGEGQRRQQLNPDNVSFMVNAIDWLSDDTGLNELRTKAVTSRPIKEQPEDSKKAMYKYGNFLGPILLVIIYGVARMQLRNRKRMRWMEERYV